VFRAAWHDYRRAWPGIFFFEIVFKSLQTWLLVPAVAFLLTTVMARSGRTVVSNWDIFDFLATPSGWAYAAVVATAAVAALLFELAGVMALATAAAAGARLSAGRFLQAATWVPLRIAHLGAIKTVLLALTLAPFALLAGLAFGLLLSGHDLYYYLKVRPPIFWLAAGIGSLLLLGAAVVGIVLYVRWSLALPILLFEARSPSAALRDSWQRVRGAGWRISFILIGWHVAVVLSATAALAVFRMGAALILNRAGDSPIVIVFALLVAQGMLIAAWSFVAVVGHALLTRQIYLARSNSLGRVPTEIVDPVRDTGPAWARRVAFVALILVLLGPLSLWTRLQYYTVDRPPVGVTAHRGHARSAPENTLSAIRKAIESGADYAEIDVQPTADGVVVLLHDRDLKRVAGDSRRLADLTFDEVRTFDVGEWFSPQFAGERVPTLAEVIAEARGRIRLNIEMKFFGPDRRLVPAVAQLLQDEQFESECLVTAFDYGALQEIKRLAPNVRIGFIVAHTLGDISQLQVDVINVRADHLTDELIRDARRRGLEVHAWTVNDPRQMIRLMQRGVDNILTSDPDLLIRLRNEWAATTRAERLILSSRLLLGLDP
jgi:glycerophosphoryl diester phosphodiesterase